TTLKIGMNYTCGGGRFVAGVNGPCARLLFASGKKRAQPEQMIHRTDECMDTAVFYAETAQIFERLVFGQINQLALDLRADHNCFSSKMVVCVVLNGGDVCRSAVAWGAEAGSIAIAWLAVAAVGARGYRYQIRFRHVARKNCRL